MATVMAKVRVTKFVNFLALSLCFNLTLLIAEAGYNKNLYGEEKVGNPYKIGRKQYVPKKYTNYQEEGYISWYGPGFHAKQTANGATFNQNTYTVAHKTLPMPSVVEITNLQNGKRLRAVVNDRGPFSETQHRILDASKKVAQELDFINAGVVRGKVKFLPQETKHLLEGRPVKLGPVQGGRMEKVALIEEEVQRVDEGDPENPKMYAYNVRSKKTATQQGVFIQVGAFKNEQNATNVLNHLQQNGVENSIINSEKAQDGEAINIIRVGPFDGEEVLQNILTKLKSLGYDNSKIIKL